MIKIGNHKIENGSRVFIIAEPGINHFGDVNKAKKIILSAKNSGADAVKFQTIFPDEVYSKKIYPDIVRKIKDSMLNSKEWLELKNFSDEHDILFSSTAAGEKSTNLLQKIKIPFFKIGSSQLTKESLTTKTARLGKPLLVSTGMCTISEIASIVESIKKENCSFALLHCNSSYPTPYEDANLATIPFLQKMFNVPIGYSDHTIGISACIGAVALGACIIEKHFILDRSAWKVEDKLSSTPEEFKNLVKEIRIIEKAIGHVRNGISKSEQKSNRTMKYSIAASRDLKKGLTITPNMITVLRPGTGIPPKFVKNIIGLTIRKDVKEGNVLTWNMFKN